MTLIGYTLNIGAQSYRMMLKEAQSIKMSIIGKGTECLVAKTLHTLHIHLLVSVYIPQAKAWGFDGRALK